MRVSTDERLVKEKVNIARWAASGGIGVLFSGLLISFVKQREWWAPWASWACLILGFAFSSYGSGELGKWARRGRADRVLANLLGGLDDRYHLFNYILPADHVLLVPRGLLVFKARMQKGEILVQGDRFRQPSGLVRLFREGLGSGLGQPGRELEWEVRRVRQHLAREFPGGEVPVEGVVAFLHEEVRLKLEEPGVSVLDAKGVVTYVREWAKGKPLPRRTQRELERAFLEKLERSDRLRSRPGLVGFLRRLVRRG